MPASNFSPASSLWRPEAPPSLPLWWGGGRESGSARKALGVLRRLRWPRSEPIPGTNPRTFQSRHVSWGERQAAPSFGSAKCGEIFLTRFLSPLGPPRGGIPPTLLGWCRPDPSPRGLKRILTPRLFVLPTVSLGVSPFLSGFNAVSDNCEVVDPFNFPDGLIFL